MTRLSTRLFDREGKQNLAETIRIVARASNEMGIDKILVFTSEGDGIASLHKKLKRFQSLFAVTFPHEMIANDPEKGPFFIGLASALRRNELRNIGVTIIQGTMPFGPLGDTQPEWLMGLSMGLGILGGGLQLCVQAILMACDAGHLNATERCVVMSADTAVIARAGHSNNFFRKSSTLAIEHILCKPQFYQISRGLQEERIAKSFLEQEMLGSQAIEEITSDET